MTQSKQIETMPWEKTLQGSKTEHIMTCSLKIMNDNIHYAIIMIIMLNI